MPFILLMVFLLVASPVIAETIEVRPGTQLSFELPSSNWQNSTVSPPFLVEMTARHLDPDMLKMLAGKESQSPREIANKILKANELFIYNEKTSSCLTIDFSPLKEGEAAPSRKAVASSARYAAESLESEDGLSDVTQSTTETSVAGAEYAYRVDAKFQRHGESTQFMGIIGFADPHWFYLYYTDYGHDTKDRTEIEHIFKSIRLSQ